MSTYKTLFEIRLAQARIDAWERWKRQPLFLRIMDRIFGLAPEQPK